MRLRPPSAGSERGGAARGGLGPAAGGGRAALLGAWCHAGPPAPHLVAAETAAGPLGPRTPRHGPGRVPGAGGPPRERGCAHSARGRRGPLPGPQRLGAASARLSGFSPQPPRSVRGSGLGALAGAALGPHRDRHHPVLYVRRALLESRAQREPLAPPPPAAAPGRAESAPPAPESQLWQNGRAGGGPGYAAVPGDQRGLWPCAITSRR